MANDTPLGPSLPHAPHASRAPRLRGLPGVILAGLLASLVGCAADPPPKAKGGREGDSAEETQRFEKSRKLLREAQELERSKSFDRARKLLKQASDLGVDKKR